jgi:hypothetical protein
MVFLPLDPTLAVPNNEIAAREAIGPVDTGAPLERVSGAAPTGEQTPFNWLDCVAAPRTSELHNRHVIDVVRLRLPRHAPPFQPRDAVRIDFDI